MADYPKSEFPDLRLHNPAFVESTVNQVVAKRFAKKQQMQWTPRGVHLLVQLRVRTLDGTLANDFQRWRDERKAA